MDDGSGLSARNRTSPRQLAELIGHMDNGPLRAEWRESLPIGGSRGSLRSRFQDTPESKALAGRIMGKTGLIGGVRALSGIATDGAGKDYYYSILANDFGSRSSQALQVIDKVALAIVADE
jgi:serine-type D-Ala-D-Ala carboxypeptidase/endopeptidase (penicillin-binding protein 4)